MPILNTLVAKQIITILLALLAALLCRLHAQSLQPGVFIQGGAWRAWNTETTNAYGGPDRHWNSTYAIGTEATYSLKPHWSVYGELAGSRWAHRFHWLSSRDNRTVQSEWNSYQLWTSLGLQFHSGSQRGLFVRIGFGLNTKLSGSGSYEIQYYDNGVFNDSLYTGGMSGFRSGLLPGPQIALGYVINLENAGSIVLSADSWISTMPFWKHRLDTPYNPYVFRLGLGIGYRFTGTK